jgi:hemin uptake protein HemP
MAPPGESRPEFRDQRIGAPRLDSVLLFRGEREIVIIHRGQEYRLRVTRTDKLILTK